MTCIYNTTNKKSYDINIVSDGIHIEKEILGNMGITEDGTGIYRVSVDTENYGKDNLRAYENECDYYGDDDSVKWWVTYVNDFNDTQDDLESWLEAISNSDKSEDEIAEKLGIEFGTQGYPQYSIDAIVEWMTDSSVDYEDERSEFLSRLSDIMKVL